MIQKNCLNPQTERLGFIENKNGVLKILKTMSEEEKNKESGKEGILNNELRDENIIAAGVPANMYKVFVGRATNNGGSKSKLRLLFPTAFKIECDGKRKSLQVRAAEAKFF